MGYSILINQILLDAFLHKGSVSPTVKMQRRVKGLCAAGIKKGGRGHLLFLSAD
jgi:hypothetical protein